MATRNLDIHCSHCNQWILRYRKQGSGSLVRIFPDRILQPQNLAILKSLKRKEELPPLVCPECQTLVGSPCLYEGKRPAFRLLKGRTTSGGNKT
jgi:hypothetical protein